MVVGRSAIFYQPMLLYLIFSTQSVYFFKYFKLLSFHCSCLYSLNIAAEINAVFKHHFLMEKSRGVYVFSLEFFRSKYGRLIRYDLSCLTYRYLITLFPKVPGDKLKEGKWSQDLCDPSAEFALYYLYSYFFRGNLFGGNK